MNEITNMLQNEITVDEHMSLNSICGATGRVLTDEQKIFAKDFTVPTISFSDAGTGKTYATAVGIVHAQTFHKVPGNKICVLSFTKESAREISQRYNVMTRGILLPSKAQFSTFHSMCYRILGEAWRSLSSVSNGHEWKRDIGLLQDLCRSHGLTSLTDMQVKKLLLAIDSMNANFIFDESNLEMMLCIKELNITPALFNSIRFAWFHRQATMKSITQGDIPIHVYFLLRKNKEIREKYSKLYDIVIVDEFQDMSILYLKILFEVANSLVVIGDMKQQIYAFNGASDDIVSEFTKHYPNARVCPLTQSFRCANEILDKAMELELPNNPPVDHWIGTGTGGVVEVHKSNNFNIDNLVKRIQESYTSSDSKQRDVMFLCRNNLDVLTVIEKLYQAGISFRTSKFKRVNDLPIFRELTILLDAIYEDDDVDKVYDALRLFPEFAYQRKETIPLLMIMNNTGKAWLQIDYQYKEPYWEKMIILFRQVQESMYRGIEASKLFNTLLPIYEDIILNNEWWRLEFEEDFYLAIGAAVMGDKEFDEFISDENNKRAQNNENISNYSGIRCYTIHSAKGLEADEVYLLDCDNGLFPSKKNYDRYVRNKCYYEAARVIRNERNLLYVAVTRARKKAVLLYNSELTPLIGTPDKNQYSYLDEIYNEYDKDFLNDEIFNSVFKYGE